MQSITKVDQGCQTLFLEKPHDVTTSAELGAAFFHRGSEKLFHRIHGPRRKGWHSQCITGTRGELTNRAGVR